MVRLQEQVCEDGRVKKYLAINVRQSDSVASMSIVVM